LRRVAAWATPVVAVAAVAVLAAAPASAQTSNNGGRPPFASGMLQSVSGSTLQIAGFNGTTSVVVTKSTKYTQTASATSSAVTNGSCVRVSGTGSDSSGIQATTVAVSPSTSKGCTMGTSAFGGAFRNGQRPNFSGRGGNGGTNGGTRPTFPSGSVPNGGTRPANFATAFGQVKSVSGDQVAVKATVLAGTPKAGKKPKTKTENVAVTLTSSTTFTQMSNANQQALAVGSCVTALGTADSVGTVTASTVAISQPQNGECSRGGGFFGGGGGGGGFFGRGNGGGGGTGGSSGSGGGSSNTGGATT
jgi:hypothetical protein